MIHPLVGLLGLVLQYSAVGFIIKANLTGGVKIP